jgi:hypothetical protein
MINSEHLRRQAAVCLRLAATADDKVATELVARAEDFSRRADEIDPSLRLNREAAIEDESAAIRVPHLARCVRC